MTHCGEVLTVLEKIRDLQSFKSRSMNAQELISLKLIAPVQSPGVAVSTEAEIGTMRDKLIGISRQKEQIKYALASKERGNIGMTLRKLAKMDSEYAQLRSQIQELETQERQIRTKLVNLAQSASEKRNYSNFNGQNVYLTYRGRELISEISQRLDRVRNMDLTKFISELDGIKSHFKNHAERAHRILKKISPEFPKTDEIHLRSASVGLAGRTGDEKEAAELFIHAFKRIQGSIRWKDSIGVALAESLCLLASSEEELDVLIKKALDLSIRPWIVGGVKEDQVRAVSIIMSQRDKMDRVLIETKKLVNEYCSGWFSAAAFLAIQTVTRKGKSSWIQYSSGEALIEDLDLLPKFVKIRNDIFQSGPGGAETIMAAALLSAANLPVEIILARFKKSRDMLQRFNLNEMIVPAAMIAILPSAVEESMDNLRLASGAIGGNRLSLGGIENLSLGLKLLSHAAVMPADLFEEPAPSIPVKTVPYTAAPSALSVTGISLATGLSLSAGVIVFHELSIHRKAERDYIFHPVHSHYIYG